MQLIADIGLEAKSGTYLRSEANTSGLEVSKIVSCQILLMYVQEQFIDPMLYTLTPQKRKDGWALYSTALSRKPKNEGCVSEQQQNMCCFLQANAKLEEFYKPTFVSKVKCSKI